MPAAIVARTDVAFTIQVEIPYDSSMLDFEEVIQQRLNDAGVLATQEALRRFDADGSPTQVGDTKHTRKRQLKKEYQTPYGVAPVERYVYRSSRDGKTYCPLDRNARIVVSATPKFAKMAAHKYAEFGSARVNNSLDPHIATARAKTATNPATTSSDSSQTTLRSSRIGRLDSGGGRSSARST